MTNARFGLRLSLLLSTILCLGGLFAYDTYYWKDSGDHDLANAANWRLNDLSGAVPQSFPPSLDTATSGSTHPLLRFKGKSELNLPNCDSLTLNWLGFLDANDECLIDLGNISKTLYLFGGGDACIWIGLNHPSGQKVTLKSGTIQRYNGTTRRNSIRMGAVNTHRGALASFVADGEDARIVDMTANLDSGNVLFCLTNGATFLSAQKNAISIASSTSNAIFRVAGEGSLFAMTAPSTRGFMLGDGESSAMSGGTIEVLDGGVVSNAHGVVGNRSDYHSVLIDNGKWYAYCQDDVSLYIGAYSTANNNSVVIRNKSHFTRAKDVTLVSVRVGSSGSGNSLYVEDSTFDVNSLRIGYYDGASGNSAVFSNTTFSSSMTVNIGGEATKGTANYVTNNAMALIDCKVGTSSSPSMDIVTGSGVDACSNRLDLVRSEWYPAGAYLGIGGAAGNSSVNPSNQWFNVVRLDDHSFVSYPQNYVYLGRGGCSNRLEVVNGSTFIANNFEIGKSAASLLRPTSGNMIYVGKDSLVKISGSLNIYPERAKIVMDSGTLRVGHVVNWHYYYSTEEGNVVSDLKYVEAEGVTFDTEVEFKGSKPRLELTRVDDNKDVYLSFDAAVRLSFELPELPYTNAAIYAAEIVEFKRVANYSFDLSKVGKAGGKYVLAEAGDLLKITDDELARMNAALPSDRSAKIEVSGNQLILSVRSMFGLKIIVR